MEKEGHFPLRVFVHLLAFAFVLFASVLLGKPTKLKVFILAGQSNMEGQAHVRTIDFLGQDLDPTRAALLKTFKPDGKELMTRDDVWVSNGGVHDKLQPGFGGRRNYAKLGSNIVRLAIVHCASPLIVFER